MEFALKILILEDDPHKRQTYETIFSFLNIACQSGEISDCLSYLASGESNIDLCLAGNLNSQTTHIKLLSQYQEIPFILADEDNKDIELSNYIGTLSDEPSYDELVTLLHYCQSFIAMHKLKHKQGPGSKLLIKQFVGKTPSVIQVRRLIEQVAKTEANVLILGESGTGKEVIAHAIHDLSNRSKAPFVPVNCGAIPGELLESELFGHEKGAFTGAFANRAGRFEMAKGGTLFLDEIGDMPFAMQVKLLRVLQERKFTRVGSNKEIEADVRIIAATHQNLEKMVEENKFREDLYYRLNVFPIQTPALRERIDDIPLLIQELVNRHSKDFKTSIKFTQRAMIALMQAPWHGNVRELSNLVERLLILHPNQVVDIKDLPDKYKSDKFVDNSQAEREALLDAFCDDTQDVSDEYANINLPPLSVIEGNHNESKSQEDIINSLSAQLDMQGVNLKDLVSNLEVNMIKQALVQSNGVVAKAAEILGLRRTTLIEKMKKYGISSQS